MHVAETHQLFQKNDFKFADLEGVLQKMRTVVDDGYIAASDKESAHYLFFIAGVPYCGASVSKAGTKITRVKDFFLWFQKTAVANIQIVKGDKKLLLCMLVKLNYKPTQSFTTDVISIEDVIKKIDDKQSDCILALKGESEWSFAIFIQGSAVAAFVPLKQEADQTELDRILLYTHSLPHDKHLVAEVFTDTQVMPSDDSAELPENDIVAAYIKPSAEAYVEVLEDNNILGSYPLEGSLTIGRDKTNDLILAEAGVSREHAVIKEEGDKYMLHDLKSANGTFFKGVRVSNKELSCGDEINIRKYMLRFHCPQKKTATQDANKTVAPKQDLAQATIYAAAPPPKPAEAPPALAGAGLAMPDGSFKQLLASITTIGKDDEADIKTEGMLVGKRHATIIRGKDVYKIVKKEGLAPMKINGEKKSEHVLRNGDSIEIGSLTMTFKDGKH